LISARGADDVGVKAAIFFAGAALFLLLATANAGGYRYGISDQAYYAAAVLKARTPALFPRDSAMLATQSSLLAGDWLLAKVSSATGLDVPALFFAAQVLTLLVLAGAAAAFARRLGFSWWTTAIFLALLTVRHHIEKTGANTLEGYFHPRVLAFACGLGALAAILGRRPGVAVLGLTAALIVHPTTAVWFGIVAATAAFVDQPKWRLRLAGLAVAAALVAIWMLTVGPLAGHLTTMDPVWTASFADRDYLFSSEWPLYAWAINLGYLLVVGMTFWWRRTHGETARGEAALIAGWLTLAAVFLVSVPLAASHLAIAVQAQVNRIFWLLDMMATAYAAWWLTRGALGRSRTALGAVLGTILILSGVRGWYVVSHADSRQLVEIDLAQTSWTEAMLWLRGQPVTWNVLADPGHAWKYGSSVRVAAERDTVLEAGKDPALGIYDRATALRVTDRLAALQGFTEFTTADLRRVGAQYAADVAIVARGQRMDLPVLHENAGFVIYALR
jgi:hypothetical protein